MIITVVSMVINVTIKETATNDGKPVITIPIQWYPTLSLDINEYCWTSVVIR